MGIRRQILESVGIVAEELVNAIYDAAVGKDGKPNAISCSAHRSGCWIREQAATLRVRWAFARHFDKRTRSGSLKGLCSEDTLRMVCRGTISPQPDKGGAGKGLFLLIQTADMVCLPT
ncbi:MAG: hypothetical protein R3B54_00300 [Bdellovibrionota bacterium]